MLVSEMSPIEVRSEVISDLKDIENKYKTIDRLAKKYNRVRVVQKIPKDQRFPIWFEIKSNKKNPWFFLISKREGTPLYKNEPGYLPLTYYHTKRGLRVIEIVPSEDLSKRTLHVYNGHFFTRYNERLNLHLTNTLDIVKRYFMKPISGLHYNPVTADGRYYTVGYCEDGLVLGEQQENGLWIVQKTFVSKAMLHFSQKETVLRIKEFMCVEERQQKAGSALAKEEYEWIRNALPSYDASSFYINQISFLKEGSKFKHS